MRILPGMNAQPKQPILKVFQPARYQIRLQGCVSADWASWLEAAEVTCEGSGPACITTLTGIVQDQPALFGLLSQVRDLGIPLIAVELLGVL